MLAAKLLLGLACKAIHHDWKLLLLLLLLRLLQVQGPWVLALKALLLLVQPDRLHLLLQHMQL